MRGKEAIKGPRGCAAFDDVGLSADKRGGTEKRVLAVELVLCRRQRSKKRLSVITLACAAAAAG